MLIRILLIANDIYHRLNRVLIQALALAQALARTLVQVIAQTRDDF